MNKSFYALNTAQFFGALNDNIFKLLCIFFLISIEGEASASYVTSIVGLVFVIPFLLFASVGGYCADKFQKPIVIQFSKFGEIGCMFVGTVAFYLNHSITVYIALFLMCTQSALLGPSKYGIIPEIVGEKLISKANGYIDAMSYFAIVLGSAVAPFLSLLFTESFYLSGLVCIFFAIVGYWASRYITSERKTLSEIGLSNALPHSLIMKFLSVRSDRYLLLAIIGVAYFSLIGAFVQLNLIPYGIDSLALTQEQGAWLFMVGAVGIGLGALLAGYYSGNHIEFGIVPIGAALITFSTLWLGLEPILYISFIPTFGFGLGAGLFLIPLSAYIQWKSPEEERGEIIASASFLSWVGVLIASLLLYIFAGILSPANQFVFIALVTLVLSVITFYELPDFFLRFLFLIITRLIYRIKAYDRINVPNNGPALLIPNHVGYVDALIIGATMQRRLRFIMWDKIYESNRILKKLFDFLGVIPISPGGDRADIERAIDLSRQALDDGYMVCIFAEGRLSRDGVMNQFKEGFEKIAAGKDCPIIPVYLGGVWGSIFSFYSKKMIPRYFPYPVSVWFGEPLPATAKAKQVKKAVSELSIKHYLERKERNKLKWECLEMAEVNGEKFPVALIEDLIASELELTEPELAVAKDKNNHPIIFFNEKKIKGKDLELAIQELRLPKEWSFKKDCIFGIKEIPLKDRKLIDRKALKKLAENV